MGTITLRTPSGHAIYTAAAAHHRDAVAHAIENNIGLHHADLSHLDLTNGNFDGGDFFGAAFHDTNLTGANMSECGLHNATFANACLHGACLAYSSLRDCNFTGALWGATDLTGASIRGCVFDTRSALLLDFASCDDFGDNVFVTPDGMHCAMNKRPIILVGGAHKSGGIVAFLDDHIFIGTTAMPYAAWMENFSPDTIHGAYLTQLQHRLRAACRPHMAPPIAPDPHNQNGHGGDNSLDLTLYDNL